MAGPRGSQVAWLAAVALACSSDDTAPPFAPGDDVASAWDAPRRAPDGADAAPAGDAPDGALPESSADSDAAISDAGEVAMDTNAPDTLPPPEWLPVASGETLVAGGEIVFEFAPSENCELLLRVTASLDGGGWAAAEQESALLALSTEDTYLRDLIVFRGTAEASYLLGAGAVMYPENYVFHLKYHEEKSRYLGAMAVSELACRCLPPGLGKEYEDAALAPLIYARQDAVFTDLPLAWALTRHSSGGAVKLGYSMLTTGRDGGVGKTPAVMMATLGRTADLSAALTAGLEDAASPSWAFGDGSGPPFQGTFEGAHPLLRVSSASNEFAEEGITELRLGLPVLDVSGAQAGAAGAALDSFDGAWQAADEEMAREGKTAAFGSLDLYHVLGVRSYVMIEFHAENVSPVSALSFSAEVKGLPAIYSSEAGLGAAGRVTMSGDGRSAIGLPVEAMDVKVKKLTVHASFDSANLNPVTVSRIALFYIDPFYDPSKPTFLSEEPFDLTLSEPEKVFFPGLGIE